MLTRTQHLYLQAMGIDVWVRRPAAKATPEPSETMLPPASPSAADQEADASLGWEALRRAVAACTRCDLHRGRTQTVFGVGNVHAEWMIIGEAPGVEEDRQGEPFVGRAGQLLNNMLLAIGLKREQVFIANILKCRPPNNRDPRPEEASCCEPYLRRQIEMVSPKLILAVGRIAGQNLLRCTTPIGQMRGKAYAYGPTRIPVVVTYHPAYLLRSPKEKKKVWADLQFARRMSLAVPPQRAPWSPS